MPPFFENFENLTTQPHPSYKAPPSLVKGGGSNYALAFPS